MRLFVIDHDNAVIRVSLKRCEALGIVKAALEQLCSDVECMALSLEREGGTKFQVVYLNQ